MYTFAPIVEGHGEVGAVRTLIERIWSTFSREDWPSVLHPFRMPKGKLTKQKELERVVLLAASKLAQARAEKGVLLLLVDADEDCAAELGPKLSAIMSKTRPDLASVCCIANVEFETWFIASAGSMGDLLDLGGEPIPEEPEAARLGKSWISRRFTAGKYSETVDQPRFTNRIDVSACRRRSPSFDKLCREIEAALVRLGG